MKNYLITLGNELYDLSSYDNLEFFINVLKEIIKINIKEKNEEKKFIIKIINLDNEE